jgi:DNA replication protein DnaT
MEWIKVEHLTPDKIEVVNIAAMLKIDQDAAFGKLIRVWMWADKYTQDGRASFQSAHAARTYLDVVTRCEGFATAMQHAGWLVVADDGRIVLPNYGRHNGQTAKKRTQTARRVAAFKTRNKGK